MKEDHEVVGPPQWAIDLRDALIADPLVQAGAMSYVISGVAANSEPTSSLGRAIGPESHA